MQVRLYDAASSCEYVYVTMTSFGVLRGNSSTQAGSDQWTTLSSSSETYDAPALGGTMNAAWLANGSERAGSYTALEVTFRNVTVVTLGGISFSAQIASPVVRINGPITVSSNGTTSRMIDLNLAESRILSGASATISASMAMSARSP